MTGIQIAYFTAIIIDLACLLIFMRKGLQRRKNKILFIGTIDILLSATVLFINKFVDNLAFDMFAHYAYHALHCLFPFIFFIYVVDLIGRWYDIKKYKTILMLIPIIIFYILLITNPINHFTFHYEGNDYVRGYGIYFEYLLAFFYMICGVYWIIKYHNSIGDQKTIDIMLFLILIVTGVLIQLFAKEVKIELFLTSVGLISIGCNVENRDQIVNRQTECYNLDTFISDNDQYIRADFKYTIILVKVASFNNLITYAGIKEVNKELLKIGKVLREMITKNDTVYYLNSATFAYLTFNNESKKISIIQKSLKENVIETTKLNINLSLLEISIPNDLTQVNEILNVAEELEENTKGIKILENNEISKIKRHAFVEKAIRYAIDNNTFKVFYQPIISTKTNKVHSVEALTRITDPLIGVVSPDEFIKVAEQTGLIFELSEKIFETVCKDISRGEFTKYSLDHVAVNLSRVELNKNDIYKTFRKIMDKYGVLPNEINLEITETNPNEDGPNFLDTFNSLKNMGFNFSLDDYGTGLSNISSIYEMDFVIVKIDKSILWNSTKSEGYKAILDSNINMLHNLKVKIVCEGVETLDQADYLIENKIEYLQGFYYSKPVSYEEVIEYIKNKNI